MDPSRAHAKTIRDLLVAAVPANVDVYLAKVDATDADLTFPYLVVWPPPGSRTVDSLAGYAGNLTTITQVTGVGATDDEALAICDRAAVALHCVTPVITGRTCSWVTQVDDQLPPIALDPDNKTAGGGDIYYGVLSFRLTSTAA